MTIRYQDPFGPPQRVNWLRMLLQWNGGILQFFLLEWSIAVITCAIITIAIYFARKDNETEERNDISRGLLEAFGFVARRFQAAVALMLGFYTVQCFSRWSGARNLEGAVMGKLHDLALQIAWKIKDTNTGSISSMIKSSNIDADDNKTATDLEKGVEADFHEMTRDFVALQLIRWLNLSHAIVIGDVFEEDNDFSSMDLLVKYGLATETESQFLRDQPQPVRHIPPFIWCMEFLEEIRDKKMFGVTDAVVGSFGGGMSGLQVSLAELYNNRDSPLPLAYRQLTHITVRSYMVILLVAACLTETGVPPLGKLTKGSFWIILVYGFEYFLFVGWLTVADAVHNPFRPWAGGFQWEAFVKTSNVNSLTIAHSFKAHKVASQLPEINGEVRETVEQKMTAKVKDWGRSVNKTE